MRTNEPRPRAIQTNPRAAESLGSSRHPASSEPGAGEIAPGALPCGMVIAAERECGDPIRRQRDRDREGTGKTRATARTARACPAASATAAHREGQAQHMRGAIQHHIAWLLAHASRSRFPELRRQTGLQQTRSAEPAQGPSGSSASISTAVSVAPLCPPGNGATDSRSHGPDEPKVKQQLVATYCYRRPTLRAGPGAGVLRKFL